MNNKLKILMFTLLIGIFIQPTLNSLEKIGVTKSVVAKGQYIPGTVVTAQNLNLLPIPVGNTDYAFYQSIQKTSNIVLGKFKSGEREILLLQDNNNDGKLDIAAHWMIELNRIDREGEPEKFCTAEDFKKLKEAIINGKSETVSLGGKNYTILPNKEGIPEIEKLVKIPSNINKFKNGMRIKKVDVDDFSSELMAFSFTINTDDGTADMAFELKYYITGKTRMSPIINQGVYCLRSEDPFAIETVKKLREITGKHLPK
ncbi:MAG: hypothetical protein V1874_16050 [Spirochaetota bacterium]